MILGTYFKRIIPLEREENYSGKNRIKTTIEKERKKEKRNFLKAHQGGTPFSGYTLVICVVQIGRILPQMCYFHLTDSRRLSASGLGYTSLGRLHTRLRDWVVRVVWC
jgi:hypothetical protein